MTSKLIDATVPKFILVGIVNTMIGTGIMFLLYNVAHCSYWMSTVANYVIGGVSSFFLNKYFTFQNKGKSRLQVVKFVLNLVLCYVISYSMSKYFTDLILSTLDVVLRENIAMGVGMCLFTALNYVGQRFWTFR